MKKMASDSDDKIRYFIVNKGTESGSKTLTIKLGALPSAENRIVVKNHSSEWPMCLRALRVGNPGV
jgi:hypothetical protein